MQADCIEISQECMVRNIWAIAHSVSNYKSQHQIWAEHGWSTPLKFTHADVKGE